MSKLTVFVYNPLEAACNPIQLARYLGEIYPWAERENLTIRPDVARNERRGSVVWITLQRAPHRFGAFDLLLRKLGPVRLESLGVWGNRLPSQPFLLGPADAP